MVPSEPDRRDKDDPLPFWERPEQVERFADRPPDERLLELLPTYEVPERTRVLDLGCAGGRNTVVLAERGFDFWAVDSSKAMTEHCRRRVAAIVGSAEADRRVMPGTMHDLSRFDSEWFDLVVSLGIYHNAASRNEWDLALGETSRVVRAGGLVLVANFSPRSDPNGDGLRPGGEANVYEGFDAGPVFLLEPDQLDAEMLSRGLSPAARTEIVEMATAKGCRATVNALYRKRSGMDS